MTDLPDEKYAPTIRYNVVSCLQHLPPQQLSTISRRLSLDYNLIIFNLNGNLNVGTCIRTAVLYSARKVYMIGKRSYDKRSTVGANHYIDIEKIAEVDDWKEFFASRSLLPIAIEQGGTDIERFAFPTPIEKRLCFIVGSESDGIPSELLKEVSHRVTIPQSGILRSLNVTVACGIVLEKYVSSMTQSVRSRYTLD